jgi:serine/threonine protein kinase
LTTAPFLSRPLGNFLLIAELSEDALGTVYRAIYAPDERRFVRLRILQSPEISPEAVFSAIEENAEVAAALVHGAIVPNSEVGLADDVPYLAWDEVAGWTLDQLLQRVRALGVRIPPEYALLVAERIASALEFAHRAIPGQPVYHGLVWPGFVSISSNAEIRLGGFGLAEALLNSIHRPRIAREVSPYAAPEARESGAIGADSDVYSLGVVLIELLTGRRPRRKNPASALEDAEPLPEELRALLTRALAPSGERFDSIVAMHRAVQELLTASPYALYTGNLALFLYRLLNPEGQNLVDAADGDATNPVDTTASASTDDIDPASPPFALALPTLHITPPLMVRELEAV